VTLQNVTSSPKRREECCLEGLRYFYLFETATYECEAAVEQTSLPEGKDFATETGDLRLFLSQDGHQFPWMMRFLAPTVVCDLYLQHDRVEFPSLLNKEHENNGKGIRMRGR
jgi:hypothetical protein